MSLLSDAATAVMRRLDPETAHGLALRSLELGLGPRQRQPDDPVLAVNLCGLKLPNCLGLAAGFDKDARVPDALLDMGFGFVECGGVTPRAQPGNPRPRLFRLSEDRAVVNRMGFNNEGLDAFARRMIRRRRTGVVGVNLGANKDSEDRTGDYVIGLKRLWGVADYFAVNVSSPNTPGLRTLQSADALDELLGRLAEARAGLPAPSAPVFLKVAPDLEEACRARPCWRPRRGCSAGFTRRRGATDRPSSAWAASPAARTPTPRSAPARGRCSSIPPSFSRAPASSGVSSGTWRHGSRRTASPRWRRPSARVERD